MRSRRVPAAVALVTGLSLVLPALATAHRPSGPPAEITQTVTGRQLATDVAGRHASLGVRVRADDLRVWRLGPGDYLIGKSMPRNLRTSTQATSDGSIELSISFDTEPAQIREISQATSAGTVAASWSWRSQGCFTRRQTSFGYIDSCYAIHKLTGESDPRDFYKLEQYGTVGAKLLGKIYDGSLAAVKSAASAPMSWIDWSPRGSISGSCTGIPLSVSALGVGFSASGVMCERWNIFKGTAAGQFREEWSCGCIIPFGQPYPNSREIDYLQAISVGNGRLAQWTLSATFRAQ
jgi:hypothetical protein